VEVVHDPDLDHQTVQGFFQVRVGLEDHDQDRLDQRDQILLLEEVHPFHYKEEENDLMTIYKLHISL
jgi:hypothetical protein